MLGDKPFNIGDEVHWVQWLPGEPSDDEVTSAVKHGIIEKVVWGWPTFPGFKPGKYWKEDWQYQVRVVDKTKTSFGRCKATFLPHDFLINNKEE